MSQPGTKRIAILFTCSDWRLHQRGVRFPEQVQEQYGVETDLVVLPGPDGVAVSPERLRDAGAVLDWARLLIGAHRPAMLIAAPHYNCAGHPVDDAEHDEGSKRLAEWLKSETGFEGKVVAGCAVRKTDDDWSFKEVAVI